MINTNGEISYTGCVLAKREESGYDDSDFYCIVYDEESDTLKKEYYASTRYCSYGCSANVDATDDVKLKAKEAAYKILKERYIKDQTIRRGDTVKIVKGRKVPVGTIGEVAEVYEQKQYGHVMYTQLKCRDENGNWFKTYPRNVEKIISEEKIDGLARHMADQIHQNNTWHLIFPSNGFIMM